MFKIMISSLKQKKVKKKNYLFKQREKETQITSLKLHLKLHSSQPKSLTGFSKSLKKAALMRTVKLSGKSLPQRMLRRIQTIRGREDRMCPCYCALHLDAAMEERRSSASRPRCVTSTKEHCPVASEHILP